MTRLAYLLCALFATGLLGLAGYHCVAQHDPPPGEALVVHDPDRDLGSQPGDTEIPLRFRLTNRSSRPIRILNLVPG
jgi:hypothetical protein